MPGGVQRDLGNVLLHWLLVGWLAFAEPAMLLQGIANAVLYQVQVYQATEQVCYVRKATYMEPHVMQTLNIY